MPNSRTDFLGAKAGNLEQLSKAGFKVPTFYVVPADTQKRLRDTKGRESIIAALEQWQSQNQIKAVAVRSSSTQEDGNRQSFAGQFATVLDVQSGEDFIAALQTVFDSTQSAAYAKGRNKVHAIVQQFIEPDISGVIFSVNPANGANEFVINAARGRGTQVVDGQQAEQYFVSRLDPNIYRHISDTAGDPTLTQKQIADIATLTLQVESLFKAPQDIEWAIRDGELYVLQARPVTRVSHVRLWDSSNISESFPGIVLPLTFSVAKRGYMLGYKAQAYAGGLSWYELEANNRTFDAMIGIFNGKMYYNLLNWYNLITLFPGSSRNQKFLDDQIATQGESIYQRPAQISIGFKLKYFTRIIYRVLFFKRELNDFYKRYAAFEASLSRLSQYGDTQLLMEQYVFIEQTIIPHFGRTVDNDFLVMTYHGWLKHSLKKWLPNQSFEQTSIIGSVSGVLSAEQALSLYRLAGKFRENEHGLLLLKQKDYSALDEYLAGTTLAQDVAGYLELFGHRFAEDQKLEAVNPVLEQYGVYKLMEPYIQLDAPAVEQRLTRSIANAGLVEDEIKKQLNLRQRMMYRILLKRLKTHLRIREKNRLLRGKVYGHLRCLFSKVGQSLVDEGIIVEKNDVYYLQVEEIFQLMEGALITNDLSARIAARKKAYKEFVKIDMPERFITKGMPSLEKIVAAPQVVAATKVGKTFPGLISSPGTIEGRVVVLSEPKIPKEPYDILVARHTDPGWTPLIALAQGVIVEHGGMLSHAAIVTRELGIPSIIGVKDITAHLQTGMRVRINTQTSSVEIIET